MLATAIAPPFNITPAPTPSLDADIQRAAELWEQANNLLLDAGRIFAETKAGAKRKFNQLIESANLEKTQVGKLVRAIEAADQIPSSVAARLGIQMLLQLGQQRSEPVIGAIVPDDTQATVAQKMKELKKPVAAKEVKPIRFIGGQKGGVGKLRIEIPGCPEAVELERNWKESGLSPLQWLHGQTLGNDQSQTVELPSFAIPITNDEQAVAQAELKTYLEDQAVSILKESQGLKVDKVSQESSQTIEALTSEHAIVITTPALFIDDTKRASQEEPVQRDVSDTPQQLTEEADEVLLPPPILPTKRYEKGWSIGDMVFPNTTYGFYPMSFRLWCEGQPVRIESVSGDVGSVQTLKVTRHDGDSQLIESTWVEEVTEPPLTLGIQQISGSSGSIQTSEFTCCGGQTDTRKGDSIEFVPDPTIYKVVGTAERWEKEVVNVNEHNNESQLAKTSPESVEHTLLPQKTDFEAPDYAKLSESIKKAQNWEIITELVESNATILTNAVNNWSPEEKETLINHLVIYLEKNKRAIFRRELDWMPIQFLKEVFFKLSFLVHDICEGLVSPWHNSCTYVDVTSFGNDDDEVWKFVNANGAEIKVWSRDDFEVLAF